MKIRLGSGDKPDNIVYDKGTIKVVVLACILIIAAVLLTGVISYSITEKAVVEKVKSQDMVYIIDSIVSKIDGRIDRAKDVARVLAADPVIVRWVAGGESDDSLGRLAKQRIDEIANQYDYSNSFIVSAVTRQYWGDGFKLLDVISETDPDDVWFFETLQANTPISVQIDYHAERKATFVFVNALIKQSDQTLGIAGVGLSLTEIAKHFQNAKVGDKSNLWLVDRQGKIHLSEDTEHNGKYLNDFLPPAIVGEITAELGSKTTKPRMLEYVNRYGETFDLVHTPARSSDLTLVFQIPRSESVAMLAGIKTNAAIAGVISLTLIIFIFYLISNRIANPLQRSIKLGRELERLVQIRTSELAETNQKIMDSIDYARRIQTSLLPTPVEMESAFPEHFVIWQPRDVVGGDFYWLRRSGDSTLLAVGDCTGHGVPGALMTMVVNTVLNHIIGQTAWDDPAAIIEKLNDGVRETVHRQSGDQVTDDGLDIALCYFGPAGRMIFASAKIPLLIACGNEVQVISGARRSIGCRRSSGGIQCVNHTLVLTSEHVCYLTTDGYLDQNGGSRDYPFGRKRFFGAVKAMSGLPLSRQKQQLEELLLEYRGAEPQRDDITVLAFKCPQETRGENNG